jgi:hypothetical protein
MNHRSALIACACVGALAACQPQSEGTTFTQWNTATTGAERPRATSATVTTTTTPATPAVTPVSEMPTSAINTMALMLAEEAVEPGDPVPQPPAAPVISPTIEPRVRELRAIVERTDECWSSSPMMRIAHMPPRECGQWFETLARGGEASGHAIGQFLAENAQGLNSAPGERLAEILASTEAQSGSAYVLRRIHGLIDAIAAAPPETYNGNSAPPLVLMNNNVRVFEQSTGFPVNETALWNNSFDASAAAKIRPAAVRALRFWTRNGQAASSWQSLSDQRLRLWLSADDPRALRATSLILSRRGSAHLRDEAERALRRIDTGTSSAEARVYARMLLARFQPNANGLGMGMGALD